VIFPRYLLSLYRPIVYQDRWTHLRNCVEVSRIIKVR